MRRAKHKPNKLRENQRKAKERKRLSRGQSWLDEELRWKAATEATSPPPTVDLKEPALKTHPTSDESPLPLPLPAQSGTSHCIQEGPAWLEFVQRASPEFVAEVEWVLAAAVSTIECPAAGDEAAPEDPQKTQEIW